MTLLLAHLDRLIATSTAASTKSVDLRAHYVAAIEQHDRKASAAYFAREERSERIRAAIWTEGGNLPPAQAVGDRAGIVRRWIARRLEQHGLRRVPCDRIIRRELRAIDEAKADGTFESKLRELRCSVTAIENRGGT